MMLSGEQTRAAMHGMGDASYVWVDMPAGPRRLPSWAKGLHIEWMEGWANAPRVTLKVHNSPREWPDKRFVFSDGRYMAQTGDGRAEVYYTGAPRWERGLTRWRTADGSLRAYPLSSGRSDVRYEPGAWETYDGWATPRCEGFGGAKIFVTLDDGRDVVLQGAWHGCSPPGWNDVGIVDTTDDYFLRVSRWDNRAGRSKPWHEVTRSGGLFISDALLTIMVARFAPECRLARCNYGKVSELEPVRPDWDEPKNWMQERARSAA